MWRKRKEKKDEFEDDDIDFKYEGQPPGPNLLDYRHMFIHMMKWAYVDQGCLASIGVAIIVTLICLLMLTLYGWLVNGI